MPVVDMLGDEFLDYVKDGMTVSVGDDGLVTGSRTIAKFYRTVINTKEEYEALFTPWHIGNVEIKNRIVQC